MRWLGVIYRTLVGGKVLPLGRDAVDVFYSPSRLSYPNQSSNTYDNAVKIFYIFVSRSTLTTEKHDTY